MLTRRFPSLVTTSNLLGGFAVTLLVSAGCGEEPEPVVVGPGGTTADGGSAAVNTGCPSVPTESCNCADGSSGTRSCTNAVWTDCVCGTTTTPVNNLGQCKAGHYEGDFNGTYRSGFLLGAGIP